MDQAWARRGLYLAGASLFLGDPLQVVFFRVTWINMIAWGLGYVLAGRHPAARAPVLLAGRTGELAYFGACLSLVAGGVGLLASGVLAVIFAGFVAGVLWPPRARLVA